MGRSIQYHYDPETKKWTTSVKTKAEDNGNKTNTTPSKTTNITPSKTTTKKTGGSLSSISTKPRNATGKAEKKYNQQVYYTLTGSLSTIANDQTLKLKTGQTIKLKGFGKYLTGDYYIESQTINISSGGLSVSFNVLKNNFRKTIKKVKKKKKKK